MKTILRRILCPLVAAASLSAPAHAGLNLGSLPLYLGASVQPLVMLNLPRDHQLYVKAYNDYSDLDGDGTLETQYKHSVNYFGYFDAFKCYDYDTTNQRFNPSSPQRLLTAGDKYCSDTGVQANNWSGNFLNWATTARIDAIRKILYGGRRVVDSGTSVADTLTVLERTVIPTDVHAWAKYYDGGATNDARRLTPFDVSNAQNTYAYTVPAPLTVNQLVLTTQAGIAVTSMTRSGTTAPCTVTVNHGALTPPLTVGTRITTTGNANANFNNTASILAVNSATQFTYTNTTNCSGGTNPGGGSFTRRYTTADVLGHGYAVGQTVAIAGASDALYNASFAIAQIVGVNQFRFNIPGATPATPVNNGGITSTVTGGSSPIPVRAITSITHVALVATVTTSGNHGFTAGQQIAIAGATQAVDNGNRTIVSVPTATTFTFNNTAAAAGNSTTGTVTPRAISYVAAITNTGLTRNVIIGDQIEFSAGTAPNLTTVKGVVTAASGTSITVAVDGAPSGGCSASTAPCVNGVIPTWTITNLSSNGITLCNVTQATAGNTETINTATAHPLVRVARGNFYLWNVGDGRSCRWSDESNPQNGNTGFFSEINANKNTPVRATVGLGTGVAAGDFAVRVKVCDPNLLVQEKCLQYPNGNWKPVGLLQDYASGSNRKIKFGLFTGSFSKNLSGGVLRKNASFLDTAVPPAAPAAADELDVNTGIIRNVDGIIRTIDRLRLFGYDYSTGNYASNADGCNSPGLLSPAEGNCSSWGNPISEIYAETLRYLAGKAVNTAFTPTPPAAGAYSTGGLTKDAVLGLNVQGWQDPVSTNNFCAPLNVLVFNASVNSYDNDQVETELNTAFGISAKARTRDLGIAEGITGTSTWLIGDKGNSVGAVAGPGGICTPKTFDQTNVLGDVLGVCPEAPALKGSYLMAGAAHWAHTTRIRTDLTPPTNDTRSLKVSTYGISLATATPKILVPVPGTGVLAMPPNSVPARFVTILPTGKTLNSGSYRGGGSIADFRVVRQDLVNGTGKFAVQWEDSLQGNDYDLDAWGVISYRFLPGNTQIEVTTQVIYSSAGFTLGFGFIISGTTPQNTEGEHFLSAHDGNTVFNYTAADGTVECTACLRGDGPRSRVFDVSAATSSSVLNEPLWYAAKYGGFNDLNANANPDQVGEWDSRKFDGSDGTDGMPDNFFLVTNPGLLEQAMDRAFIYILQVSSASSVATNSTSLTTGSRVYQARFNSNEWSGQLLSFTIDSNGVIDPVPNFDAGQKLPPFGSRTIIALNPGASPGTMGTPRGIPFRWTSLTADQQIDLRRDGGSPNTLDATTTLCTADNVPVGCTNRGQIRVNYLRGDQSNEGATATRFRVRPTTPLADIINSTPRFIGPPSASFTDASYLTFRSNLANRTPMLYVGSNGGMMHAFEATTGSSGGIERLAYVPSKMFPHLTRLTHKTYSHRYYVDGTPSVNDACFGGCASAADWKTVAVGGYNSGGQGYYALDVSDPTTWSEGNAGGIVLWEFTDVNDPDLGFTYSKPLILKMSNGRWAAIFGNGYNSSTLDTGLPTPGELACTGGTGVAGDLYTPAGCSVGLTGYAYLYIVFLDGGTDGVWTIGTDYIKISTQTSTDLATPTNFTPGAPNGIGTPVAVDSNGDGQTDFVYAGDLVGNLWKFDLQSSDPTAWVVASSGEPLFRAVDAGGNVQPITSAPVLFTHPSGGLMVMFGTGKYLEQNDDAVPYTMQAMYGIWDKLDNTTVTRSQLMEQKVLAVTALNKTGAITVGTNQVRITSAFSPNYGTTDRTNSAGPPTTFGDPDIAAPAGPGPNAVAPTAITPPQRGWLLDFPNSGDGGAPNALVPGTGERVVFDPLVTSSKLVYTTLIPSIVPCESGGTSFVMDMDPVTGSRLAFSPFDLNNDSNFTAGDFVTYGGVQIAVTGLASTIGIVPQPTVIAAAPGKEIKVLSGSSGGLVAVLENAPSGGPSGSRVGRRVTWRELLSN